MPTPRRYRTAAERQAAWRARQAEARNRERAERGLPAAPSVPTMPSTARWNALLAMAKAALDAARNEMQEYYDDRSETWQAGERGEAMQERIDALDTILADLEGLE
jgi:hypothetical protein